MPDFICVLMTSEGCGHCSASRGNGDLGNGKPLMTYRFLNEMLKVSSTESISILNIHFQSMAGMLNQIESISKIYFLKDTVFQEKYFQDKENNTYVSVKSLNYKEKLKSIKDTNVIIDKNKINWIEFLSKKIPKNIERYTYFYPCFVLFKKEDWKKGGNILGITTSGYTEEDKDGIYGLEKNPETINKRNVPPKQLILDAYNKKLKFEPHIRKLKDYKEEKKKTNKKVSFDSCDMVVKNYDDF